MWLLWISWSLLTCTSALLCFTGCLVASWLKGTLHVRADSLQSELLLDLGVESYIMSSSLGLYRRCVYPVYVDSGINALATVTQKPRTDLIHIRHTCGHYAFDMIPHLTWRIGLALLSIASIILVFLTFFFLLSGCYLRALRQIGVHRTCQVLLLIAGSLVFVCCGIYPLGWNQNTEVQQICGDQSATFRLGRCQIGWAYLTTLLGGFLAIFAAVLPSICINQLRAEQSDSNSCWTLHLPWKSSKPGLLSQAEYKYGLDSGPFGIQMGSMVTGIPERGMTSCCTPALAHQPLMGPTPVFLCSSMTPVNQPFTQTHSIHSQFTNTSSLEGSSNELGQRSLIMSN